MPKTNQAGLDLIKSFEGCELEAYQDVGGVWTIGYGHTGPDVHPLQKITQAGAELLLQLDLHTAEREVNSVIARNLTPNQFAALVSFEYNTGSLASSTLLRLLNAGDIQGAADQFLRWNKVDGRPILGLTRRRAAERELFLRK